MNDLTEIGKAAGAIASYWNGSDETFIDGNGEMRRQEDVLFAEALLEKIKEVRAIMEHLHI